MDINSYNNLFKLLQEYCQTQNITGDEFIEEKLLNSGTLNLTEDEISKFVLVVTHRKFLEAIKSNVVRDYNLRNYNDVSMLMVIFVIVFCDHTNTKKLFELYKDVKCAFKSKLLEYFCNEDNIVKTALTGCKFFEDDYILNEIINPLLNKRDIFQKIIELLFKEKVKKRTPQPTTVPDFISVLQRKKPTPIVPLNTPAEMVMFQAKQIPMTTYQPDNIERRLMGQFEKNKLRAQKLLEQAKALNKNYCKPIEKTVPPKAPPCVFRAKRPPKTKKPVDIKGNIATVLRQASRCVKEQEEEIRHIQALMQGSSTLDKYKELENSVRQLEEQKSLEDIEKKHLEGLLTFEDAILAKKKLLAFNKERFKQFMEERTIFLQQIQDWKNAEEERMKEMVKKGQEIERKVKESEKKHKEEIRNQVTQFKDEIKKMLQEAYEKQQEELTNKVKLIEEIRTLHHLKSFQSVKEFDPSECPNLGLLCEMSISDLQSKLSDLKLKMERQLEEKRKCIQKQREKQKRMIENVKNFITQTRMSKPKRTLPNRPTKLVQSPELDKLRRQLEHARERRKNSVQVGDMSCPSIQRYLHGF